MRGFRRAQYLLDVDFHVGAVAQYLRGRLVETGGRGFLAHAVLDLPDARPEAGAVVDALREDGLLLVFQPSVSQIADVVAWARAAGRGLRLELVVELPMAVNQDRDLLDGTGGREWDVRIVGAADRSTSVRDGAAAASVCRPRVGGTIGGGGFVAAFRKLRDIEIESDE